MWDESINATSAFEMAQSGDFIVRCFDGEPDMWNTRPPLAIWAQALFMKIFGYNELAVRLPSALSALLIIIVLFRFFTHEFGKPVIGYFTSLVLISSGGFIAHHVSRTGDHDIYLILFLVISIIYFYKYLHHKKNRNTNLLILTIALILAALSKGISAFLFLPGMCIYVIYRRRTRELLADSRIYFSILLFLVVVLGYYLLRNHYNPGFLKSVWNNELGGRYLSLITFEEHRGGLLFYVKSLALWQFVHWILFIPICFFILFFKKNHYLLEFNLLCSFCIVTCLVCISLSDTKIIWYVAPVIPLLSCIVGAGLSEIFDSIKKLLGMEGKIAQSLLFLLFVLAIFALPYSKTVRAVTRPREDIKEMYGPFMKKIRAETPQYLKFAIMHHGWNSHIQFYLEIFNAIHGYDIERVFTPTELKTDDMVLTCQDCMLEWISEYFDYETIDTYKKCGLIRITKQKALMPACEGIRGTGSSKRRNHITNMIGEEQCLKMCSCLLRNTDLMKMLKRTGPYTFLAPADSAFDKLPDDLFEKLHTDMSAAAKILLYHIIPGKLQAEDLKTLNEASTCLGEYLSIEPEGESIKINGAQLIRTNIEASNGVIHIIDTVILPKESAGEFH